MESVIESHTIKEVSGIVPQFQVGFAGQSIPQVESAEESEEIQGWMLKLARRQDAMNKKYKKAYGEFARAYNDFLDSIDEINMQYETPFTFGQAVEEFQGKYSMEANYDDEG